MLLERTIVQSAAAMPIPSDCSNHSQVRNDATPAYVPFSPSCRQPSCPSLASSHVQRASVLRRNSTPSNPKTPSSRRMRAEPSRTQITVSLKRQTPDSTFKSCCQAFETQYCSHPARQSPATDSPESSRRPYQNRQTAAVARGRARAVSGSTQQ